MPIKILVTGGSGFFGFRLVNHFLEQGYTVVTSVRSENPNKVKKLYNLQEKYRDKLSICIADLMVLNSFDKPCSKVDVVMHTATPVILDEIEDYENQLYKPAVQGTQNILDSCLKSNKVKVIIYTSSVGTMASHYPDPGVYNESSWQQVDKLEDSPYHYSKIQAEKLFLKFIEDNPKFRGIVINPGAIMGPYTNYELEMVSPYQVNNNFDKHVNNKIKLENYYKDYFPFIDVRDLAKAHELSMNNPNANGRFVLVSARINWREILLYLNKIYPNIRVCDGENNKDVIYDSTKAEKVLGIKFNKWEDTIEDTAKQLVSNTNF